MKIHHIVFNVPIISTACTIHSLGDFLGEKKEMLEVFFLFIRQTKSLLGKM